MFSFEYFICSLFLSTAFPASPISSSTLLFQCQICNHLAIPLLVFHRSFIDSLLHFQRHFHSIPSIITFLFPTCFLWPYRPFMFCLPIWVVISELPLPSHVSVSVSVFRDLIWQRSFLLSFPFLWQLTANCICPIFSPSYFAFAAMFPLFPMLFFRFQSFASICCVFFCNAWISLLRSIFEISFGLWKWLSLWNQSISWLFRYCHF